MATGDPTLDQLLAGIREQESGGNYHVVNSFGAVGAYQILKSNIPEWTREALGTSLTWQQFRDDKDAQDKTARYKIGQYYTKYGARGAASAWYSGNPNLSESTRPQPGGPSVKEYVDSVIASALKAGKGITGTGGSTNAQQTGLLDVPGAVGDFFSSAVDFLKFFSAFTKISTWVRVGAGLFGMTFLMGGIVFLVLSAMEK